MTTAIEAHILLDIRIPKEAFSEASFLIGAHAQEQAARLLSRGRGFYRQLFPSSKIVDPSRPLEHS